MEKINLFWFRRDLRLEDNAGLYHALKSGLPLLPIFIFDKNILDVLPTRNDARVTFIYDQITQINQQIISLASSFHVFYSTPVESFESLLKEFEIETVFTNEDYEPYALERDQSIGDFLNKHGAKLLKFKDQVIFEKNEVTKEDGKPYTVYTPYSRKWKEKLNDFYLSSFPTNKFYKNFYKGKGKPIISLQDMGFQRSSTPIPSIDLVNEVIHKYDTTRNYPGITGTSRIGIHLRFGTVSIRALAKQALKENNVYLNELIWRDFYFAILFHFPKVGKHRAFKEEYEHIQWRNNEEEFKAWCNGLTGYPIVDAGMRELNETGYMHNRVRMIVASFLTKHLLIDWRWGEAYFADKLLDFDLAANNGGWQWAAGSGCDASPYFRIFNPYLQTKKFDADLVYIKKWVPEFEEFTYPQPIVDHEFARKRCLEVYGKAVSIKGER